MRRRPVDDHEPDERERAHDDELGRAATGARREQHRAHEDDVEPHGPTVDEDGRPDRRRQHRLKDDHAVGPVLGAFAIMPLAELLRSYLGAVSQGLHLVIFGGFVIVVMLYFPRGLAGALERPAGRAGERTP